MISLSYIVLVLLVLIGLLNLPVKAMALSNVNSHEIHNKVNKGPISEEYYSHPVVWDTKNFTSQVGGSICFEFFDAAIPIHEGYEVYFNKKVGLESTGSFILPVGQDRPYPIKVKVWAGLDCEHNIVAKSIGILTLHNEDELKHCTLMVDGHLTIVHVEGYTYIGCYR